MARAMLAWVVAGCGRIGFDPLGETVDVPAEPRWLNTYASTTFSQVAEADPDGNGGALIAVRYQGAVQIGPEPVTAMTAGFESVLLRTDANGGVRWQQPLFAGAQCDLRTASILPDGNVIGGGLTSGPSMGGVNPCDVGVGSPQDPIMLQFTDDGSFVGRILLNASVSNAQLRSARGGVDRALAVLGNYRGDLIINGMPLPQGASCCEAVFIGRIAEGAGSTPWQLGMTPSTGNLSPDRIDVAPNGDVCVSGRLDGTVPLFGNPTSSVGAADVWVARIARDGTVVFARAFGSSGADDADDVLASDDGCVFAMSASGDVDLGPEGMIVGQGSGAIALEFNLDGTIIGQAVMGASAEGLAQVGDARYIALVTDEPLEIAGTLIEPEAIELVIVELDRLAPKRVVGRIATSVDLFPFGLQARGNDLLAFGGFIGTLRAGELESVALASATETAFVVAFPRD